MSALMCGIAGTLGISRERAILAAERMQQRLRHRGPDDLGIQVIEVGTPQPPAVLVHTRLSIVELSQLGHQPMMDMPQGQAPNWITYNGEVYNSETIWAELAQHGFLRRSRSDTEVILHAYRFWGESAVEHFDGMFAFCLVDTQRRSAWLCRDRVGVKPLYVYELSAGGLVFASELRALLDSGLVPRKIHRGALESLLAQGAVIGEQSIVEGVELLGPGESRIYDFEGKRLKSKVYWRPHFEEVADSSEDSRAAYVAGLRRTLQRAVVRTLRSDAPLGLFLSSGIDSAAIATLATEVSRAPIQSLTLGFDQPEYDESQAAAAIAQQLGTVHRTQHLSGRELLVELDAVLNAMDQPTVDGFNTYHVSRAARAAGLTVVLSGLGGDELFGGYASFRDVPKALMLQRSVSALPVLQKLVNWGGHVLGPRGHLKCRELLRRPAELAHAYLLRRELFLPQERRALQPLPVGHDAHSGLSEVLLQQLRRNTSEDWSKRISELEYSVYMRHMLLRDSDVFSMALSVELRVPLLEYQVVETVAAAKGGWLRPDPRPKPLLVDAAGPRLPERVWQGKKRGFSFPWKQWLLGPMREHAQASLADVKAWQCVGFELGEPARLWQRFSRGEPSIAPSQVVCLMVLSDYVRRHELAV